MTITDRIEVNPRVMLGKPVIRGTRIPVELLLRKLSEGSSESDLLEAYPGLTREDIHAAMRYAADTLGEVDPPAGRYYFPPRFLIPCASIWTLKTVPPPTMYNVFMSGPAKARFCGLLDGVMEPKYAPCGVKT
jgi:uncharacterized protein (DUF433 family)